MKYSREKSTYQIQNLGVKSVKFLYSIGIQEASWSKVEILKIRSGDQVMF